MISEMHSYPAPDPASVVLMLRVDRSLYEPIEDYAKRVAATGWTVYSFALPDDEFDGVFVVQEHGRVNTPIRNPDVGD